MNDIENVFLTKKNVLIPYICAGDPDLQTTASLISVLDQAGAGIIELGIPFSDPLADGPVIQAAGQRALKNKCSLQKIVAMAGEVSRDISAPLVLMGYYNSILSYGIDKFIADLLVNNISGVIIPDLPFEEDQRFYQKLRQAGLAGILLAAPNTSARRLQFLGEKSSGFLYCVSLLGVTGDANGPGSYLETYLARVRENTDLPLALGFGIDGPARAKAVSSFVDGIIIGSALIKIIDKYNQDKQKMFSEVKNFIEEISASIS